MTNLMRLQLELNNQPYLEESDLCYLLEENGLDPQGDYTQSNRLKLLYTVLAVFQILTNDIDLYRQIETEFTTTGEAIQAINKRIVQIKAEIGQIEAENESATSPISYLFRGRC